MDQMVKTGVRVLLVLPGLLVRGVLQALLVLMGAVYQVQRGQLDQQAHQGQQAQQDPQDHQGQ